MDFLRTVGATFFIFITLTYFISAVDLCDLDTVGRFTLLYFQINCRYNVIGLNADLAHIVDLSISRALCIKRLVFIYASYS